MTQPGAIRLLVAEDNQLMRRGIVSLVGTQPDLQVVAEAEDGARAITAYRQHRPHVVLLDLKLPVMDGVHVTRSLLAEDPGARIVILSHYEGDEHIFQAIRAGARGYVTKEMDGERILEAIRRVHEGQQYLPANLLERLTERMRQPALTFREQQVLEHVFRGLGNREIAETMGISQKTVGIYVGNILSKLNVRTRTEAIGVGLQRGLLSPDRAGGSPGDD